jgi:hypothetical protein
MGGYFSGRHDGRPVVKEGWTLDLAHGIRQGMILPGRYVSGLMNWTLTRTGEVTCSIGYEAKLSTPFHKYGDVFLNDSERQGNVILSRRMRHAKEKPLHD